MVPQSQIIDAETELEGLRRRRDGCMRDAVAPEVLRAPIDGVIAAARVVAGQVVQAQDLLFQIVDPASLWVEAFDYGEIDPATLKEATAVAAAGQPMTLAFQGCSRACSSKPPSCTSRSSIRPLDPPHRPTGHGDRQEQRFRSPA